MEISTDSLQELMQTRRAVRLFDPHRPVTDEQIAKLLEAVRWAPTGYNLQPTHVVLVTQSSQREAMVKACMGQRQVRDAPLVTVLCGDREVLLHNFEKMLDLERKAGNLHEKYEAAMRKFVPMAFATGPMGLGWLAKVVLPLASRWMLVPSIPAVHRRYWLAKQVALGAMNYMLMAEAMGLATCPMEGFGERAVARTLGLPRHILPILVMPTGYAMPDPGLRRGRLPVGAWVHHERWQG